MLELTPDDIEQEPTTLAPDGIGHIMTNEEYHSLDSISSSSLSLLEESSLHLKNRELFKLESDNLSLGSAVHNLTLEPEKFDEEFAVTPKDAKRNTTIGKAKWDDFNDKLAGRIALSNEDYTKAQKMARNLKTILGKYLETGIVERSFFSTNRGIDTRCRPDLFFQMPNGSWIIFDLKTTKDIKRLDRVVEEYRYDRSMAWYRRVMQENGYTIAGCVLAFVDSTGTAHDVKVRALMNEDLDRADEEIEELLIKHEQFINTGQIVDLIKPLEIFKWKIK